MITAFAVLEQNWQKCIEPFEPAGGDATPACLYVKSNKAMGSCQHVLYPSQAEEVGFYCVIKIK